MGKKKGSNTVKKGKKQHRKSVRVKINKFYDVSGNSVKRLGKDCPKCGVGIKMAEHNLKDGKKRFACGKCTTTVWE